MKPVDFEYFAPATVEEAVGLLRRFGADAKLLAGGQSLVPLLNMRLARPKVVIDLQRLAGLRYIKEGAPGDAAPSGALTADARQSGALTTDAVQVGALTTHHAVESSPLVRARLPLLAEAVRQIGHRQIRNRGTHGGSLVHADPAAELPVVALALGAELEAVGPAGSRRIAAEEFFLGFLTTSLGPDEVLTAVRWPVWAGRTGASFREVARRQGDFALVAVAAQLSLDAAGCCTKVALAAGGVGPGPLRLAGAEAALQGRAPTAAVLAAAAEAAMAEVEPDGDLHASAEYRRQVTGTLVRRSLAAALERAGGAAPERAGGVTLG